MRSQPIHKEKVDFTHEIQKALNPFPGVKYTFNPSTGKLFLVGHVSTGVEKSELCYNLQALTFLKGIEDKVVIDESIWQEMNLLLSRHPDFQGVSMHAPSPGRFVLTGYLKTIKQSASLKDYINLNFNYLACLENLVVVEEEINKEINGLLLQGGLGGVSAAFANGEVILSGYINSHMAHEFQRIVNEIEQIRGVTAVRNYVVPLSPEQAVVDLNERYPGRFQVTGYSKHCNVNINVVINGRIYGRGDEIEGMIIKCIQPDAIFFEREGMTYKIKYNNIQTSCGALP